MNKCETCMVRKSTSFRGLTNDEIAKISECKGLRMVKRGKLIFEEGENLNGVYCIRKGICKLFKLSPNGKYYIVKLIGEGGMLGQRSLLQGMSVSLSAMAIEDMEVCFIPKAEIFNMFETNAAFSTNMMRFFCDYMSENDDALINLAENSSRERLAYLLIYLHNKFGTNPEDKSLRAQLSRDDIANIIGTATENCIRLLSDLKKNALIQLKGKKIIIIDMRQLRRM